MAETSQLRNLLLAELRTAIAGARSAAGSVDRDANAAVHEFRKSLRRARAVIALLDDALPRDERRSVHRALREARRALGPARDHAVLPETVARLGLEPPARTAAEALVVAAIAPEHAHIAQALAEGATRAAAQVEIVEGVLPETIEWPTVVDGVRKIYRSARRALRDAKRSKRAFHAWRRRTKELTYQLELIARLVPPVGELARSVEAVADTQGPVVDLIMMRRVARAHNDQLADTLEAKLGPAMAETRKAARAGFRMKPREFARGLTEMVSPA